MCAHVFVRVCVRMCVYVLNSMHTCIYMCVCVYVNVCVRAYVCNNINTNVA